MNQRGFIALPPLAWAAIAAGVVIAGLGIALKIQSARLESCQADRVKLEAQSRILGAQLAEQNRAVQALREAGIRKEAAAAQALARATQRARTWEDNAARLRGVLTAPRPAGEPAPEDCKAAWAVIREGK